MPNHVENDLTITGTPDDIAKFKVAMSGKSRYGEDKILNEDALIPYPVAFSNLDSIARDWEERLNKATPKTATQEERQNIYTTFVSENGNRPKDGFNQGGYEWCVKNWGTKWGFYGIEIESEDTCGDETTIKYTFRTAWSPPIPLIKVMGDKFPALDIDLRYFESGAGFNGLYRIKHGILVDNKRAEYFGDRGG